MMMLPPRYNLRPQQLQPRLLLPLAAAASSHALLSPWVPSKLDSCRQPHLVKTLHHHDSGSGNSRSRESTSPSPPSLTSSLCLLVTRQRPKREAPSRGFSHDAAHTAQVGLQSEASTSANGLSVPVMIVGGGPVGLTLSFFLSKLGVGSLLVERSSHLPQHPQAHFINNRSMEIFRHMDGLADDVMQQQPPLDEWREFVYCESMRGQVIGRVDHFKQQEEGAATAPSLSPTSVAHLSQHRLLPLLLQRATAAAAAVPPSPSLPPLSPQPAPHWQASASDAGQEDKDQGDGRGFSGSSRGQGSAIWMGVECCHVAQGREGVVAGLRMRGPVGEEEEAAGGWGQRDPKPGFGEGEQGKRGGRDWGRSKGKGEGGDDVRGGVGKELAVSCRYLVAADGANSFVRRCMGIEMEGEEGLQRLLSIHFSWPSLGRELLRLHRAAMLYFVFNTEVIAVVVAHDLQRGEFVLQLPFYPPAEDPTDFTPQLCRTIIRQAAAGPGFAASRNGRYGDDDIIDDIVVHSVRPWVMSAQVASSFLAPSHGRIILLGDAAHRFPPAGGFGMNTGLQDAHNLAWKLAAAERGIASPSLLKTFERERKQVATANCRLSVSNFHAAMAVPRALGLDPAAAQLIQRSVSLPPFSLLPRSSQRSLLHSLLSLGRSQLCPPLSAPPLLSSLLAARHNEARRILSHGESLQLQFPREDLGYVYEEGALLASKQQQQTREADGGPRRKDSGATLPFAVGCRFPHFPITTHPPLPTILDEEQQSSTDLVSPATLSSLFVIRADREGSHLWLTALLQLKRMMHQQQRVSLPFSSALLVDDTARPKDLDGSQCGGDRTYMHPSQWLEGGEGSEIKGVDSEGGGEARDVEGNRPMLAWCDMNLVPSFSIALVRPDGHVAWLYNEEPPQCAPKVAQRALMAVYGWAS